MNNKSRNRLWQFPNMSSRGFKCNLCVILWCLRDKNTLNFGNAIFLVGHFTYYDQSEVPDFWTSGARQDALHSTEQCIHWLILSLHRISLVGALLTGLPLSTD